MEVHDISSQVTVAAVCSWAIEHLKRSPRIGFITEYTKGINRVVAVGAALVSSAGVTWTFDVDQGTLLVHGLTLAAAAHIAWDVLTQIAVQHGFYRAAVHRPKQRIE